ncbi:GNAT family N-acetyltransferase [Runella sp.]|uniref:GNAT family N-acetyltransferase n=1 Tax=Runella sp. TaxID=1960881 RepID=UPI003D0ADDDD
MPVLLLHRSQLNSGQWDEFVAASPQCILYAYSWYLDTVSPDWQALVLVEKDQWQAVMPLPCRRKWGMNVVQQPFFCQLLGVFTAPLFEFTEAVRLLLDKLPFCFRYISIYTGRFGQPILYPKGMKITNADNFILPLKPSYSLLFKNYTHDRKTNLLRAQKFGWQSQQSTDIEPLIKLFQENHAAQIQGGVSANAYYLLQKVVAVLQQKKALRLVYALKNGQIEAGALFAIFDDRIIYLFNAASATGRKGNARTWLIDQMIQKYAQTDFIFDFESPELSSISSFYQSFGAEKEGYTLFSYNDLPFPLKQIQEWRVRRAAKS